MTRRRLIALFGGILLLAAALAPSASAVKPTFERIAIDDTFADEFLTDACGVPVSSHAQGHITVRAFAGGRTGPERVATVNVGITATANGNTYRFRDVGADHVQVKPDGTVVVMIIGQLPFDFTGVVKFDLDTGEVTHEPHHDISGRLDDACAALTA